MSQQLQRFKSFAQCLLSGASPAGSYHLQKTVRKGDCGPTLQLLSFTIEHVKSWTVEFNYNRSHNQSASSKKTNQTNPQKNKQKIPLTPKKYSNSAL